MAHECHATNCKTEVPPKLFMCRAHWRMVPARMKDAIWRHYRPGQEVTKDPSPEYMEAAMDAIRAVAAKEKPGG